MKPLTNWWFMSWAVWLWRYIMPQQANHSRTPIRVDIYNNFYKLDALTGSYVPISTPNLEKQIAISHVRTFIFDTDATVVIDSRTPGASGREHVKAKKGDMLLIWSNGDHKIVPPDAQKWVTPDPSKGK